VLRAHFRDLTIDFWFDRAVAFELGPWRHADLHKGESPAKFGPARQHTIDRLQPLGNPFRVIEAIDADAHDVRRGQSEHLAQAQLLGIESCSGHHPLNAIVVDAYRHWDYGRTVRLESHSRPVGLDLGAKLVLHREHEVAAIAFDLEGEQIVGQQSGEQLAPPLTRQESIRVWPWYVPEHRRPYIGSQLAQICRGHREVVVLQEHWRIDRRHFLVDRSGKYRIHILICGPVFGPELGPHIDEMTQRP
jgi:hypothetical protein